MCKKHEAIRDVVYEELKIAEQMVSKTNMDYWIGRLSICRQVIKKINNMEKNKK